MAFVNPYTGPPDTELDEYCDQCVSRYAGRPVSMAGPIDTPPAEAANEEWEL